MTRRRLMLVAVALLVVLLSLGVGFVIGYNRALFDYDTTAVKKPF